MQLPTVFQQYIHKSRYARWLWEENRRETWNETVDRYFAFFKEHLEENNQYKLKKAETEELKEAVLNLKVMPSMRALMTAGPALKRENIAGFNCSYVAVDHIRAFDEVLYILMNGTGVGFSVESRFINKLPVIAEDFYETDTTIVVADSKLGWAKAYKELISLLYSGQIPKRDTTKVRPAGSPLKTFGGRASGPEPLIALFDFTIRTFQKAAGRKLTSIECHDLVCMIGEVVVVGGVRRSALISLSDLFDDNMRMAKSGQWWETDPHRKLANNSYVLEDKPNIGLFMKEWLSLYESKSGERGIFSRKASQRQAEKTGRREFEGVLFGTNPCSEIILRSMELCNLSEVVARDGDDLETLKEKVRLATILGTFQSTLTNFRYVRKKWKENCDEERLLGVSITGIMDCDFINVKNFDVGYILYELQQVAIETNKEWAKKLGINQSVSITCVKPSGTVSQLVDAASGIHTRFAPYYIRRARNDVKDPLSQLMIDAGVPYELDLFNKQAYVFSFPVKSPTGAITRNDLSAIEQLEFWKKYQDYWTEHKPSVTITVKEDEWFDVGAWVWNHLDEVSGISFLPYDDHVYQQAPYEEITHEEYNEMIKTFPKTIDWSKLSDYEDIDMTKGSQELACSAGGCEIL